MLGHRHHINDNSLDDVVILFYEIVNFIIREMFDFIFNETVADSFNFLMNSRLVNLALEITTHLINLSLEIITLL